MNKRAKQVPQLVITSVGFLDWWNSQTIKAQEKYIKTHSREDRNYKIAAANRKILTREPWWLQEI